MYSFKKEFSVICLLNFVIYGVFVVIGYYSMDINSVLDSYKDIYAPKIDYDFYDILKNNMKVCMSMILGCFSLGVISEVMLAYNGYVFGTIFAIGSEFYGWEKCLEATLPHSIEILGIVLSASLGMSIAVFIIRLFFKGAETLQIKHNICFYLKTFLWAMVIIVLAAYLESYVSIK